MLGVVVNNQQHGIGGQKRPDEVFQTMSSILEKCQNSVASHPKLIAQMKQLFAQTDLEVFTEKLIKCLRSTLIVIQKNTNIDRCLDFVAKFTAGLTTKSNSASSSQAKGDGGENNGADSTLVEEGRMEEDGENDEDHFENPLFTRLIDFLIQCSTYSYDAVRYRSCQMLGLMMAAVNNDQFIDEEIYFRLLDALLERLKDINSRVQIQAIAAIYRLQDPCDRECRVIKALSYLINYDPNWQVRYQALGHIAYSKQTLTDIIDRVKDPSPHVRKKSLLILSEKVLIKFISIERRLFILNYSLNDSDEGVLEVACRKLLPSWLTFKENDMCKLLKALDVVDATQTCELMLDRMHSEDGSLDSSVAEFGPLLLNEKLVIPMEKLNAESAFYWCWICAKCKSGGREQKNGGGDQIVSQSVHNDNDNEGQNYLDKLLPSLTEFCDYFRQVLNKIQQDQADKSMDDRQIIENTFILRQLLRIFNYVDFSDVHGKKTLLKLCHELLSRRDNDQLFENIMSVYKLLNPNVQQRINEIVELISDIRDPGERQTQKASTTALAASNASLHPNGSVLAAGETPMDIQDETTVVSGNADSEAASAQIDPHEIKMKISELKFKRFNLKEAFENIYKEIKSVDKEVDINKLAELRESIRACEDEISILQSKLDGSAMQQPPPPPAPVADLSPIRAQSVAAPAVIVPVDPFEATAHCLRLSLCLLTDPDLKNLTPQMRSLCDTLILPNIGSVNEELRALATRALSLVCLLKLEMAQKYIHLLIKIMEKDKMEIVVEAFTGIINCIMAFSINKLITASSDIDLDTSSTVGVGEDGDNSRVQEPPGSSAASNEHQQRMVSKILSQMASLLDHEDSEVSTRAVEGFCKLYMTGHILSAKLFSKLLIMYFSPLTEHDVRLRSVLSNFLPQFAFLRASNQVCVEESFMITLKHLINAPPETHLAEIDLMKVMELLLQLTNPKNLVQQRRLGIARQTNNICHENIVKSICMELLKEGNAFRCKTYLKIAQLADLGDADYHSLKNIWQLVEQVHEHIDDRTNKKTAKKFVESIEALLNKMPEYIEEQERKKLQTEQQSQDGVAGDQTLERVNNTTNTGQTDTTSQQEAANKKDKSRRRDDDSDDDDGESDSGSPKLLDPMFKKINRKAKTDKTKAPAPAPAVTASAITTTAAKKQTRLTSLSAKTPSTSRVSTLKSSENNGTRSTRKKQAAEEKQDENEQNETTSTANETTNTQKEDITVISTSAVIPETPPTVGRMSTRNRVQSKTEETSLVEPKPRSSIKKTPVTALKSPIKKTPEVENDDDEASTRRRSTRSQTVESAQRIVESPKEPSAAPNPSGASRIQIVRASSSARIANKPVASESSTSTKENDYEPPTKVSRSSVNSARVSSREKEKQSAIESRVRVTRSSSGHKKSTK